MLLKDIQEFLEKLEYCRKQLMSREDGSDVAATVEPGSNLRLSDYEEPCADIEVGDLKSKTARSQLRTTICLLVGFAVNKSCHSL